MLGWPRTVKQQPLPDEKSPETLVDLLSDRALGRHARRGYTFFRGDDLEDQWLRYGELHHAAQRVRRCPWGNGPGPALDGSDQWVWIDFPARPSFRFGCTATSHHPLSPWSIVPDRPLRHAVLGTDRGQCLPSPSTTQRSAPRQCDRRFTRFGRVGRFDGHATSRSNLEVIAPTCGRGMGGSRSDGFLVLRPMDASGSEGRLPGNSSVHLWLHKQAQGGLSDTSKPDGESSDDLQGFRG